MIQDIKCCVCRVTVLGSVALKNGEVYKGDEAYGYVCDNHDDSLEYKKSIRLSEIDNKTVEIIDRGFDFDGYHFSMSAMAQRNWTGIAAGIGTALFTEEEFPLALSATDQRRYDLSWENVLPFLAAYRDAIAGPKVMGTILKQQILDAETLEALDAVIDTRP